MSCRPVVAARDIVQLRHNQQLQLTALSVGSRWRAAPASGILFDAPQLNCGRYTDPETLIGTQG